MNSTIQLNLALTEDHPYYSEYKSQAEKHNNSINSEPFPNSGFDLYIPCDTETKQFQTSFVDLGIKATMTCQFELNDSSNNGIAYQIYPRSSLSKYPIILANHVGIIDSGYRGNLIAAFRSFQDDFKIEKGNRLVQICHPTLLPFNINIVHPNDLNATTRGSGGFGSTGV